ncbi:hypothetical protein RCO28_36475 [Streptomyces sp. LHD-70]|nr:hypothetical protein [Streptomyces sp. LHD-70]MDQ8707923.1 hypothetical protein [Streptomyces sp. LHD-70]
MMDNVADFEMGPSFFGARPPSRVLSDGMPAGDGTSRPRVPA